MKFINNNVTNFLNFLIILLPLALVSGPFISDLIVVIISLVFIVIYKRILENKHLKKIFFLYLIFYFYLILNSLFTDNTILSLKSSITHVRFIFFLLIFCFVFINIKNFKYRLLISVLFIYFVLCLDSFIEFFLGYNILGYKYNGSRIQSLFGSEWIVGSYLSKILPIIICLVFYIFEENKIKYSQKSQIFIIGFLLSLGIFVTTLSGERSALFSVLLYSFLLLIFLNFNFFYKIFSAIIFVAIFFLLIFSFKPIYERIFKETYTQLNIFSNSYKKDHQLIFETSYNIFKDHNKLIGVGLKGFRTKCKEEKYYTRIGCTTHPHNFYLLFLTELGIIGVLFLIFTFLYMNLVLAQKYINFKTRLLQNSIYSNQNISIFLGLYVFLFPFKTEGNFFNNWMSIIFIFQCSLLVSSYLYSIKKNEKI